MLVRADNDRYIDELVAAGLEKQRDVEDTEARARSGLIADEVPLGVADEGMDQRFQLGEGIRTLSGARLQAWSDRPSPTP